MFHLLYKYLILHRQVVIPGIGLFSLQHEPAKHDHDKKVIHAPSTVVKFQAKDGSPGNDFYKFLSDELSIGEVNATEEFEEFAYQLKQGVISKKWVVLPGMGILTQGIKNEIRFKPAAVLKKYYPAVPVGTFNSGEGETVTEGRQSTHAGVDKEHPEEVSARRDNWRLYALLLAVIGIAAIVYYYSTL
jgi:hypothetical protein